MCIKSFFNIHVGVENNVGIVAFVVNKEKRGPTENTTNAKMKKKRRKI